jgi:hypothetical protein
MNWLMLFKYLRLHREPYKIHKYTMQFIAYEFGSSISTVPDYKLDDRGSIPS